VSGKANWVKLFNLKSTQGHADMKTANLAAILAADLLRPSAAPSPSSSVECFTCGRSFSYRTPHTDNSGRFCTPNCRLAFDHGLPPYEPPSDPGKVPMRDWLVAAGPPGLERGSRYYAPLLDRKRPRDPGGIPSEDLIRKRRTCSRCGARLPVWLRGKRVPLIRKFCDGCR
jgi:hypothetical protein